MKQVDETNLLNILRLLEERLRIVGTTQLALVVCGGSALIATKLVARTTQDVDIVCLMSPNGDLLDPEPLPHELLEAASVVARNLSLPEGWLNCGPADLFRMGLPQGFADRLEAHRIGPCLTVHFIGRLDQIHFKLYAAVDRGGYHITDLLALKPSEAEIELAARWSMTHDVSEGYAMMLKQLLGEIGYGEVAVRL